MWSHETTSNCAVMFAVTRFPVKSAGAVCIYLDGAKRPGRPTWMSNLVRDDVNLRRGVAVTSPRDDGMDSVTLKYNPDDFL